MCFDGIWMKFLLTYRTFLPRLGGWRIVDAFFHVFLEFLEHLKAESLLTDTTIQRWELPLSILKERLLGKFLFDISEVFNLFDPWDFNRFSRRSRRSWPIVQGSPFLLAT